MAMLIWELGANSSAYRKDLEGLTVVTKDGFQRIGQSAREGSERGADGVKGLQHGIRELKELVLAGGAVEMVKRFFEMAADAAEKARNAGDENAAAVLRFTSAAKSMKETAGDAAMTVVGVFNRVGESIGNGLRYAKEFWQAAITGNKANMEAFDKAEESERAANEMERTFAEEKKKHGEEYKRINDEIRQTQEEINQAKFKELDPAQKIEQLAKERAEIEEGISSGNLTRLQTRQNELALLKNEKDMIEAQAALEKQQHDAKIAANKLELDATLKGMDTQQKLAYLVDNIRSAEVIIAAQRKAGADTTVLQAQLEDLVAQKTKVVGDREKENLEARRRSALSIAEEIEYLDLMDKKRKGMATGENLERIKQLQLIQQRKGVEDQLEQIAQKAIDNGGKLSAQDEKKREELTKQKTKLDEQLGVQAKLIEGAKTEQAAQEAVTDEYHKQVEEAQTLNKEFKNFTVSLTRVGESYDQQSTEALKGVRDRISKQYYDAKYDPSQYQTYANGERVNIGANILEQELSKIDKELNLRAQVQQYASRYGESAARYQFGDTVTQRALSNLSDQSNRAAISTEQINQRLASAGFGLNGPTTR